MQPIDFIKSILYTFEIKLDVSVKSLHLPIFVLTCKSSINLIPML